MKKYFSLVLLLALAVELQAQPVVVFKGTVKCYIADDPQSTRGAKNVVVVPGFIPIKAGVTNAQGYYEINTAVPLEKLDGKYITVYYISSCKECEQKKNVFVSEDQLRRITGKAQLGLSVETMLMAAGCRKAELPPFRSDSILNAFAKQPSQDLDKASQLTVLTATPGFLNFLTKFVPAIVTGANAGGFNADTAGLSAGSIAGYGRFLFASPMNESGNTGFNFSPARDLTEAVFWNPAALAAAYKTGGVFLFTNLKNNLKFSGFAKLTDRFTLGVGTLLTKQDNYRNTRFTRGANAVTASHFQELKESAVYLSPSFQVNEKWSVGLAVKSIWQTFNIPDSLFITPSSNTTPVRNDFFDGKINDQHFDADLSVAYKVSPSFQVGLNAMNLAGTELYADAFAAGKKLLPTTLLRSLGLGLCYKYKQFNFGADALWADNGLYDVSLGVNYVPFNNALLSGGFAFKQQSFSLGFRWKYFRLTYVNDQDLLVNQRRVGKASILNGQLYSGIALRF